jgi:signal-transduction protein with cAMP-binding, CBS, and nucleotidyltransferase domain
MRHAPGADSKHRVHTLDSSATVEEARRTMLRLGVKWLAVSDRGTVVGTVDQEQLTLAGNDAAATVGSIIRRGSSAATRSVR